ncbi:MAG: TadE family protein [Terriglobia bacterium]
MSSAYRKCEISGSCNHGQALVEFAIVLPFLLLLALGVIEFSYAIYAKHVVIKMAREGSNLISRNTSLVDAGTIMTSMANTPVDLNSNHSLMIFSVIRIGSVTNVNKPVLYKRRVMGSLSGYTSILSTSGTCNFVSSSDYANSAVDGCLIAGGLPAGVVVPNSGQLYMTEVYNTHNYLTPAGNFGISSPNTLYANAYF